MRGFLAVARREIAEQRGVFGAAAAAAILPFFAPLLPGRFGEPEARLYTAAFFAVAFAALLSLLLGATAIGRDLTERRLGFYFSRPIGGAAIWAGKLAGAWLLVLLAALIILLPAGLFDLGAWTREARSAFVAQISIVFVSVVLVFLALGNVASLALRSRSVWLAGDFVALAVWVTTMGTIALPLLAAGIPVVLQRLGIAVAAACAAALLAAGGAQVSIGRGDAARGTRVRFAVLWTALFTIALLLFGFTRWLLRPGPADFSAVLVGCEAPRGTWVEIEGHARGRADLWSSIFYDVASGRHVAARSALRGVAVIAEDGSAAAWTEPAGFLAEGLQDVWTCRFSDGRRVRTAISSRLRNIAISPEGSRLAVTEEGSVGIYELPAGRLLGSFPLTSGGASRVVFEGRDRVRLYRIPSPGLDASSRNEPATVEVLGFDIPSRRLEGRAAIPNIHRPFALTFADRAGRILVWERGSSLSLFDANTGRLVAVLGNFGWESSSRGFLSDGRIAVAESTNGVVRVHLFSTQGEPEKVFDAGRGDFARIGAEPSEGQLALSIGPELSGDAFLLDLRDGSLRRLGKHLDPVAAHTRWRLRQPDPGSVAARLFSRSDWALLLLDPATGKLATLFRGE